MRLKGLLDLFLDVAAAHSAGDDLAVRADEDERGDRPDAECAGGRAMDSATQERLLQGSFRFSWNFLSSSIFSSTLRLRIANLLVFAESVVEGL